MNTETQATQEPQQVAIELTEVEFIFINNCRKEGVVLSSESLSTRFGPDATEITITDSNGTGFTQCFKSGIADGLPYPAETKAEKEAAALAVLQTAAKELAALYPDGHPKYTRALWKEAVANDDTDATYYIWLAISCAKDPEQLAAAIVDSDEAKADAPAEEAK